MLITRPVVLFNRFSYKSIFCPSTLLPDPSFSLISCPIQLISNCMKKEENKPVSALKLTLKPAEHTFAEDSEQPHSLPKYTLTQDEDEFQKLHQQYLNLKITRKKEEEVRKRQQFGPSSSEQDDVGASESPSDEQHRPSTLEQQKRYLQSKLHKDNNKVAKEDPLYIFFAYKKGKEIWSKQTISFQDQHLAIADKTFLLKEIHKIKIIQGLVVADCNKIKLSCTDGAEIFVAANHKPHQGLPLNYFIFAFVIQHKLINMGVKLYKCQPPTLPGIPEALSKNSYNFGKIYKKSSLFGIWEERLIVINKDGIYAYKKFNEKHSMFLSSNNLKEIWTRFEIEEGLLVIKILHGSSKTQFGIPLTELLDKRSWLYSFYLLAFPQ